MNIIWLIVLVALAAAYPSLFLFLQNYDYIRFVEVLPYLAICVLGGLLLFAVIWALSKRRYYSALISTLVLIVCLNTGGLIRMIEDSIGIPVICLLAVLLLGIGAAAYLIWKKTKEEFRKDILSIVSIVLVVLTAMNAFPVISSLFRSVEPPVAVSTDDVYDLNDVNTNKRPNIYYMIFDEYSGSNTISKYYGYDIMPFYDRLRDLGFTVSEESYTTIQIRPPFFVIF